MNKKICSSCNHDNTSENFFCTRCGSKMVSENQMHPRLCVLYGDPKDALFLIRKGRNTIGHDCGNLIVLGDDLISNKHAIITHEDENYWIEDRNSKNGVIVNGNKISARERLINGSVVKLGSTILRFENYNSIE